VPATIDIVPALREIIDEAAEKARARGLRLAVALPTDARAVADRVAVRRIVGNLLGNALQYSPSGGTVRLEVRNAVDWVTIGVRDQGLGFTADELARACEPFRRFDRPGCVTGAGMGLAVSTLLAKRMGGSLRLASVQSEGTTVELKLAKG
jgi:signal transduction histidine kinase